MISHNNQECKAFAISLISAREYQEDDNKNNSCNSAKHSLSNMISSKKYFPKIQRVSGLKKHTAKYKKVIVYPDVTYIKKYK